MKPAIEEGAPPGTVGALFSIRDGLLINIFRGRAAGNFFGANTS